MFNAALDDIGSTKWQQCVTEISNNTQKSEEAVTLWFLTHQTRHYVSTQSINDQKNQTEKVNLHQNTIMDYI